MVQLTITNVCDMACTQCAHPVYRREEGYKPSFMDMDLYHKITEEMKNHPWSVLRIFGWGEPLLHPHLAEMIAEAKARGIESTNLITNGLKLDQDISTKLVRSGLDVLEISLDAATPQTYALIRGSERNHQIVAENIRRYVQIRDDLKGWTYVTVSIINQPKAAHEIEDFRRAWQGIADDVIVRTFHDFQGYALDGGTITLPPRHPCRCLWSRFNVNSEGLVNICFNDWHNKDVLGDLKDPAASIAQIWTSPRYEEYRASHLDGKPKGICGKCRDWIGASWSTPYETLITRAQARIAERRR